jgi:insulysin
MFVKAVRDVRQLEISFVFPDESAFYATKPGSFLSHLIGHEGQGSVLSYLKRKGWANGMSAGAGNGAIGFEFFKISVDLTKEGLGECDVAPGTRHRSSIAHFLTPRAQQKITRT